MRKPNLFWVHCVTGGGKEKAASCIGEESAGGKTYRPTGQVIRLAPDLDLVASFFFLHTF